MPEPLDPQKAHKDVKELTSEYAHISKEIKPIQDFKSNLWFVALSIAGIAFGAFMSYFMIHLLVTAPHMPQEGYAYENSTNKQDVRSSLSQIRSEIKQSDIRPFHIGEYAEHLTQAKFLA